MSKGVVSGLIWGVLTSVVWLGVLSVLAPSPEEMAASNASKPAVETPAVETPAVETPEATPAAPPAETPAETPAEIPAKPVVAPPAEMAPPGEPAAQTPVLDATPVPDTVPTAPEPAAEPATPPVETEMDLPAGSEFNRPPPEGEARLPGTDEPAMPGTAPASPQEPVAAATPPATDTAPPAVPDAGATTPGTMMPPETGDTAPEMAVTGEEPVLPSPGALGPSEPATEKRPALPQITTAPPPPAAAPAPEPEPEPETAKVAPPVTKPEPTPAPNTESPILPGTAASGGIRVPVPGGGIAAPNVRTGRLPTIGGQPSPESKAAEPVPTQLGALARYAVPFKNPDSKPLFSIILIDAGKDGLDRDVLKTFSFPVTFAIDASRPDAAEAMADYRNAGFEVVLLAGGLPGGATPKDLEVTLGTYLERMPQTVAIMDGETGGVQSNRPLLRQMMQILNETGHGLITYDRGLNAAEQIARSEGIPSSMVFRMLDSGAETAPTVRRYLDRAAFKAAQDGHVIMAGHTYPETVTALFSWALEGKDASVIMAPVSAVLRAR